MKYLGPREQFVRLCILIISIASCAVLAAADGQLVLNVIDRDTSLPTACRMHLKNAQGKPITKSVGGTAHGDHIVFYDKLTLRLPLGSYMFTMDQGPESLVRTGKFDIQRFADDSHTVDLKRLADLATEGWYAGDLDVARATSDLPLLMQAEGLHFTTTITWDNDKSQWPAGKLPRQPWEAYSGHRLVDLLGGQDRRHGTELIFSHLREPLTLPARKAVWPSAAALATTAQKQGGWNHVAAPFARELPLLIAAGKLDSVLVLNRHLLREGSLDHEAGGYARDKTLYSGAQGNGRWSLQLYYQLLEAGIRLPFTAGSGSGTNSNPLGYNRVYAWVEGEVTHEKWWESVRRGRTFITNGPLLRCSVQGEKPGHTFAGEAGQPLELLTELTLSTRDKIDYLEIVKNGQVDAEVRLEAFKAAGGKLPPIRITESGWFMIRAVTTENHTLRYASTAPYYVEFQYQPRISRKAVQFFIEWVQRELNTLNSQPAGMERDGFIAQWTKAQEFWTKQLGKATTD